VLERTVAWGVRWHYWGYSELKKVLELETVSLAPRMVLGLRTA